MSLDDNSQRRAILVADDDLITRRIIEKTLVKWGYEPILCSNGKEALELLLRADGPTIAILDWMMPGLEGVQVCRRIRKSEREGYVYLMLLTSKQTKEDLLAGLEAGADAYLTKPFDPDELKLRLNAGIRILDSRAQNVRREDRQSPAVYDFASHLWSDEAIIDALRRELAFSQRDGSGVGAVLVRVADVEAIREKLGDGAVESSLKEITRRMIAAVRPYDYVGTHGPDCFLVVVRSCNKVETLVVAERLRSAVSAERVWTDEGAFPISIALGATVATGSARTSVQAILQAAETAVRRALGQGANRVAFEWPTSKPASPGRRPAKKQNAGKTKLNKALILAAAQGNLMQVKRLLDAGADVNCRDKRGNSALIEASFGGAIELVKLLLDSGADVGAESVTGDTPITEAIRLGNPELLKLLLSKPLNPDAKRKLAALYKALAGHAENISPEILKPLKDYLLRKKTSPIHRSTSTAIKQRDEAADADKDEQAQEGPPAPSNDGVDNGGGPISLVQAARRGDRKAVQALLQRGANVNAGSGDLGGTPLIEACRLGHKEVVRVLLQHGADVNAAQEDGATALRMACIGGHVVIARAMLASGADIDATDKVCGSTPLVEASGAGHVELVQLLLENGADRSIRTKNGLTASGEALLKGHTKIAEMLGQSRSKLEEPGPGGSPAVRGLDKTRAKVDGRPVMTQPL